MLAPSLLVLNDMKVTIGRDVYFYGRVCYVVFWLGMLKMKAGSVLLLEMWRGCVECKIGCIFVDQHNSFIVEVVRAL